MLHFSNQAGRCEQMIFEGISCCCSPFLWLVCDRIKPFATLSHFNFLCKQTNKQTNKQNVLPGVKYRNLPRLNFYSFQ